ncbi:MAG: extracellular solute-binding protein [Anaerolineales bacterium]|nr:extracellular solute-binding protein [Anaerolineales bacterium]
MYNKKKKFSRRDFLRLGGLSASAVVLASCAPKAEEEVPAEAEAPMVEEPAAPEPVEIEFLAWGDNADIPAWEQLSKNYMEMNPNVTVNVTAVADPGNNMYPKLQTMVAGGSPPDVSSFQGWEWQTYADKDLLAPIDAWIERDNFTGPYPDGNQTVEDSTMRNGKRYLIPLQAGTMVMFYLKEPFDEAGLPYPTDDWTFEEFLEIADKLTTGEGDTKKYGLQANGSWFRDIAYIRSTGKQEFDTLIDPKKIQFNQPEIVDIIQLMAQDVFYSMGVAPSPADLSGGANTFQVGSCAMKYEGAWFFPNMNSPELREDGAELPFDVVLMPKYKDEARPHRGWSEGVVVMNGDKAEDAWGFASYMGGDEGDKIYSEVTGRIPGNFNAIQSFWIPMIEEKFGVKNGQAFVTAFNSSEVDVVGGVPRSKMWSEIVKPEGYDPLMNNSATAAEVLPKVDEALQVLVDEYWENL